MTSATETGTTTHVFQVWIKATPEAIWDAITKTEWTERYGYRAITSYDLRPGGAYSGKASPELQAMGMAEDVVDGEVIEVDPPRRLVQTWRFLWDDDVKAEGPTRVTFDIGPTEAGGTKLTVTHELQDAPITTDQILGTQPGAGGGWSYVLSDIKTLLETGKAMGEE
jgi:uncharacterized protein YndB with AHSA1/START domain